MKQIYGDKPDTKARLKYAVAASLALVLHAAIFASFVYSIPDAVTETAPGGSISISLANGPTSSRPLEPKIAQATVTSSPPASNPPVIAALAPFEAAPVAEKGIEDGIADGPDLTADQAAALAQFEPQTFAGQGGGGCDLNAVLATSLAGSEAVQGALESLPASERSVANAVMLWDGNWPADTRSGGKALIRAIILKAVAEAPAHCLLERRQGPVLFLIPDRGQTSVIAVGSGAWAWRDILSGQTVAMAASF